jgi:hypothetical protein
MENIKPNKTSNMADRIIKCFAQYSHRGLHEASLLELQNQEDSFSTNLDEPERQVTQSNNRSNLTARVRDAFTISIAMWVDCLKTVIITLSARAIPIGITFLAFIAHTTRWMIPTGIVHRSSILCQ